MIEFNELVHRNGRFTSALSSPDLPAGMYYRLWEDNHGRWCSKSRADGNGSIRYHSHRTLAEAQAHGVKWAKRKIAEAKRAAKAQAPDEDYTGKSGVGFVRRGGKLWFRL